MFGAFNVSFVQLVMTLYSGRLVLLLRFDGALQRCHEVTITSVGSSGVGGESLYVSGGCSGIVKRATDFSCVLTMPSTNIRPSGIGRCGDLRPSLDTAPSAKSLACEKAPLDGSLHE